MIWIKFEISIKKVIRHQLLACNSKWNVFLNFFYPPSVWLFGLIQKCFYNKVLSFDRFSMKEIRRYPDFVLFVVLIVFAISVFLQGCSTWCLRHSYCTIPLYCQYCPNLRMNYKTCLHSSWSFIYLHCWSISWKDFAVACGRRD